MDHASRSTLENIHAGMSIPVAGGEGVGVPKAGSLHPGAHHTVGSKWAEVWLNTGVRERLVLQPHKGEWV